MNVTPIDATARGGSIATASEVQDKIKSLAVSLERLDTKSRYRNALFGLALGDAWGYRSEFTSYLALKRAFGGMVPSPEVKISKKGLPAGVWYVSDDTQMTLALDDALDLARREVYCALSNKSDVISLKHVVDIYTDSIVNEFQSWAQSPLNTRAPGASCMTSLMNQRTYGVDGTVPAWHDVVNGAVASDGCGAVMRALPAIFSNPLPLTADAAGTGLSCEREDVIETWRGLTALQAMITHRSPAAVLSAIVLAEVTRLAISWSRLDELDLEDSSNASRATELMAASGRASEPNFNTVTNQSRESLVSAGLVIIGQIRNGSWEGYSDLFLREVMKPVLLDLEFLFGEYGESVTTLKTDQDYEEALRLWFVSASASDHSKHSNAAGILSRLLTYASAAGATRHPDYDLGDPCEGIGQAWDAPSAVAVSLMIADAVRAEVCGPAEALEWAATSNGDSDSIAAIVGGLIGSLWGIRGSSDFEKRQGAIGWLPELESYGTIEETVFGLKPAFEPAYAEKLWGGSKPMQWNPPTRKK
ncbi:hypothetical protein PP301_gp072 [Gordonia phage GMA2]|uniref:ADP-ribosylglycohydrolase n=1 Tax=Gordonia phage GMA2 TaxID=1647283 RepID=A0A0K0N740_9CAUD|nr:hypothetical protein PP301_gp072 [Gordonia phage GMA2]AKJ72650.1 hypothetical protein GMA2_112 [Gordonia phage GMA2]